MQMEYTLIKYNSVFFENNCDSIWYQLSQQNRSEENIVSSFIGFITIACDYATQSFLSKCHLLVLMRCDL